MAFKDAMKKAWGKVKGPLQEAVYNGSLIGAIITMAYYGGALGAILGEAAFPPGGAIPGALIGGLVGAIAGAICGFVSIWGARKVVEKAMGVESKETKITRQTEEIQRKDLTLQDKEQRIHDLGQDLTNKDTRLTQLDLDLTEKVREIQRLELQIKYLEEKSSLQDKTINALEENKKLSVSPAATSGSPAATSGTESEEDKKLKEQLLATLADVSQQAAAFKTEALTILHEQADVLRDKHEIKSSGTIRNSGPKSAVIETKTVSFEELEKFYQRFEQLLNARLSYPQGTLFANTSAGTIPNIAQVVSPDPQAETASFGTVVPVPGPNNS